MSYVYETRTPGEVDPEVIFEYLQSHAGKKFLAREIGRYFNTNHYQTRKSLDALGSRISKVEGNRTFFFYPKDDETELTMASTRKPINSKPYKPSKQLGERCSELYPEHKGFVSFKGHEPEEDLK